MNVALLVLALFLALALGLGLDARRGKGMNLEEWSVGGRGFGSLFVFLLLAGEIYTTFTFLGASGYAYTNGGAGFYILCYGALAYVLSYWLAPAIWRFAKQERLISQPDWFVTKYRSRNLGLIVTLLGRHPARRGHLDRWGRARHRDLPAAALLRGISEMFHAVQAQRPGFLSLHEPSHIYQLILLFVLFTGLTAVLVVPVLMGVALYLTFQGGAAIVNLLLLGYAFVTQLFPSMIMSLLRRNPVTKWGAGAGMLVGAVVVAWLTLGKITVGQVLPFLPESLHHLNVGVIALVANIVVCALVSWATRAADASTQEEPVLASTT